MRGQDGESEELKHACTPGGWSQELEEQLLGGGGVGDERAIAISDLEHIGGWINLLVGFRQKSRYGEAMRLQFTDELVDREDTLHGE